MIQNIPKDEPLLRRIYCTHDRLITLGTSEDGLEEEYKCLDCGRVLSTLDK